MEIWKKLQGNCEWKFGKYSKETLNEISKILQGNFVIFSENMRYKTSP
jgi:hypothetical protein